MILYFVVSINYLVGRNIRYALELRETVTLNIAISELQKMATITRE